MILVVGATGLLGSIITRKLLAAGEAVRILVRDGSPAAELARQRLATPAEELIAAGAQPVHGDLKEPDSLARACVGIETVISTANSILRGGADTVETVDRQGTLSLIEAAEVAGVGHFIYVSVLDPNAEHPDPFVRAKAACAARLRAGEMTYTILAADIFLEIWVGAVVGAPLQAGAPVTLVGQGEKRHAFVSVEDVAEYAVTAVHHPAARNMTIRIGGPRGYNWSEIVATVGGVLGRSLPVKYVGVNDPVPLLPEKMVPLLRALETYESQIEMTDTAGRFGVEPTSLRAFSERFFEGGPTVQRIIERSRR